MTIARILPAVAALVAFTIGSSAAADSNRRFMTLASGQAGGIYLPVAEAICQLVNRTMGPQGYYCSAEPTPGSLYNLESLARGEADFAIVQADIHYKAFHGEAEWAGKPMTELRSVLSLHAETITILTRRDAGITGVEGLRGKRVNIGSPGSGTRASWVEFADAVGFFDGDFADLTELRPDQATDLLCSGELDASFLVIGHPSETVSRAIAECDLTLVPVVGPAVSALIAERPYYVPILTPGAAYGLPGAFPSYGGRATLVTTSALSQADVEALTKVLVAEFEALAAAQPNLAGLEPKAMIRDSLTAPLHEGAERAYRDLGLLPE